jgi:hypothetical protein
MLLCDCLSVDLSVSSYTAVLDLNSIVAIAELISLHVARFNLERYRRKQKEDLECKGRVNKLRYVQPEQFQDPTSKLVHATPSIIGDDASKTSQRKRARCILCNQLSRQSCQTRRLQLDKEVGE